MQPRHEFRGDAYYRQHVRHAQTHVELFDTDIIVQIVVGYNHLVREGILQAVFCVVAFFAAIGCLITFLFELTTLKDILEQRNITGVFLMMEFMLAIQYRDTIKKVMIRFQRGPRQYYKLLNKLYRMAYTLALSVDERKPLNPEQAHLLDSMYNVILWMNVLSLRIFSMPHRTIPLSMPVRLYALLTEQMRRDPSRPADLVSALLFVVGRQAGELRNDKVLTVSQEQQILKEVNETLDILEEIEGDSAIGSPPMIDLITLACIGLFVLFVIPLQIYSQADVLTPLLYPIIAIVFTSVFLFWIYYNEPFSPFSHYKAMDFGEWRRKKHNEIRTLQKRYSGGLQTASLFNPGEQDSTDIE